MKNYTYSGWKLNGFIALLLNLAFVGVAVYAITVLASSETLIVWALVALIASILAAVLMMCGYIMLELEHYISAHHKHRCKDRCDECHKCPHDKCLTACKNCDGVYCNAYECEVE